MMGGGGGGSGSAPQNFLPPGQGEVAGQLPGLIAPMRDQGVNALSALNGVSPAQSAYPFVQGTTSNILNNPYQGHAVTSAQQGDDFFNNFAIPTGLESAGLMSNLGRETAGAFNPAFAAAFNNPEYSAAQGYGNNLAQYLNAYLGPLPQLAANPAYAQAQVTGNNTASQLAGAVPQALARGFGPSFGTAEQYGGEAASRLGGAASSILNTAFDPQRELYGRTLQQVMDQQNAINAQAGVAGSPYGAGIAGDRASNFALDWQDRQLGRQTSGGQAAAGLYGQGVADILGPAEGSVQGAAGGIGAANAAGQGALSSLITPANSLLGAWSNAGQTAGNISGDTLQSLLRPANAQVAAALQGSSALGNLSQTTGADFGSATSGLTGLASGIGQFGGQPYSAYNTIQGNNFGALQNEINLGNANYLLPQQTVSNLEQYLGLGQSASQIASQIASTNNQIGATNFGQLSSGLGGASQLAFGSQGPFGSSGLLGGSGLFGGGAGAASADFGGGGAALGVADSAFADPLAAAAPLAFSA